MDSQPLADEWHALNDEAQYRAKRGDYAGAEEHLRQAIAIAGKLGPKGVMLQLNSLFGLSLIQEEQGKADAVGATNAEMIALAENSEVLTPADVSAVYIKAAEIYERLGNLPEACKLFERIAERFATTDDRGPEYVDALLAHADLLLQMDTTDSESMRQALEEAVAAAIEIADPELLRDATQLLSRFAMQTLAEETATDGDATLNWAVERTSAAIEAMAQAGDGALLYLAQARFKMTSLMVASGNIDKAIVQGMTAGGELQRYFKIHGPNPEDSTPAAPAPAHDHEHSPDCGCEEEHAHFDAEEYHATNVLLTAQLACLFATVHRATGNAEADIMADALREDSLAAATNLTPNHPVQQAMHAMHHQLEQIRKPT